MISDLLSLSAPLILKKKQKTTKDNLTNVVIRKSPSKQLAPAYLYTKALRVSMDIGSLFLTGLATSRQQPSKQSFNHALLSMDYTLHLLAHETN